MSVAKVNDDGLVELDEYAIQGEYTVDEAKEFAKEVLSVAEKAGPQKDRPQQVFSESITYASAAPDDHIVVHVPLPAVMTWVDAETLAADVYAACAQVSDKPVKEHLKLIDLSDSQKKQGVTESSPTSVNNPDEPWEKTTDKLVLNSPTNPQSAKRGAKGATDDDPKAKSAPADDDQTNAADDPIQDVGSKSPDAKEEAKKRPSTKGKATQPARRKKVTPDSKRKSSDPDDTETVADKKVSG